MPGEYSAVSNNSARKVVVHEPVDKVRGVAHPLVRNAAGEFLVEAEFAIDLRIKWTIRFGHQPFAPVGVRFADLLGLLASTPTWPMIIPDNLDFAHVTQRPALHDIARSCGIWFAAMLRAHLDDTLSLFDRVTRRL